MTADLKLIYRSSAEDGALRELERLSEHWENQYPQSAKSWRNHWQKFSTLFNNPEDIRKAIYTTNTIESLNCVIGKAIK